MTLDELTLLTKRVIALENQLNGRPACDPQTILNKTNIERLDLILTHHQKEIEKLKQPDIQIKPVFKLKDWIIELLKR
uniref:Uncharacterized protein n=2 Tax=viral metagenome TaxID=1070528 RepID=A0A6H1ZNT7_9ZZZZ